MVIGGVFTDPDLDFPILVLANHGFGYSDGAVNANQPAQTMQREYHLLSAPLTQLQEAISIYQHLFELFVMVLLTFSI
jgi:hypothetical protein